MVAGVEPVEQAVRAPPIWRNPVGEGAKRVTTWLALTRGFSKDEGHDGVERARP
jgi:hypothetical protein